MSPRTLLRLAALLLIACCGISPAAPPAGTTLPPDLQRLLNKAQSGKGLTPAEVQQLQRGMTDFQKRLSPSGSAATRPVGTTGGTSGDGLPEASILISYTLTASEAQTGLRCDTDIEETWTKKTIFSGRLVGRGRISQSKPGGSMGTEAIVVFLDSGRGAGRTVMTGADGHKPNRFQSDWSMSSLQGAFWMRSFPSRGDRMTGEPVFIPQMAGTYSQSLTCPAKNTGGRSPAPEGMGHILSFLPSFSIEQLSSTHGLDIARQHGMRVPAGAAAAIAAGGPQAFTAWKDSSLCDWGISLNEFKRGFNSHKPFEVVGAVPINKTRAGITYEGTFKVRIRVGDVPEVELVVRPQNYANWRPKGGANESTAGGVLPLTAILQTKDGKAPPAFLQAQDFKFELTETSSQPGVCLNQPLQGATTSPDLKFDAANNAGASVSDRSVQIPGPGTNVSAVLSSYDWGAWGKIKVTATLDDGSPLVGYLEGHKSVTEILLPKRKPSSKIADAFNAPGADSDDKETQANNPNKGDGFTNYEEYRGLMAKGAHVTLKTDKKDIVIENLVGSEVRGGFALFEGASGIRVVEVARGELPQDRVANLNKGHANGGVQHGLRVIRDANNVNGTAASANHISGADRVAKSPKECIYIGIACDANGSDKATIAHEIAHACGVKHHGDRERGVWECSHQTRVPFPAAPGSAPATGAGSSFGGPSGPPTPQPCSAPSAPTASGGGQPASSGPAPGTLLLTINASNTNIKVYDSSGAEITQRPYTMQGEVGIEHSKSSGDDSCLMFYNSLYQWAFHQNGNQYSYWAMRPHAPGSKFCTSQAGTGINAAGNRPVNFFSDAQNGNCMKQFLVKDW